MINAAASTSSTSGLGASPMPVVPPKVLPSHGTPQSSIPKTVTTPHQDIDNLQQSLADKIGTSAAQESVQTPSDQPPTPTAPTLDTPVTPPPKRSGFTGKNLLAIVFFLVIVVGGGVAYYLQQQNQDVRQQAAYYDNAKTSSGLVVKVTSAPNSSSASKYKPASSNVSDPNSYYDQSKGETVSFTVPVQNEKDSTVNDKHELLVFKIDEALVNGTWVRVDENSQFSEEQIYNIHKGSDDKFQGTKQTFKYATGWKDFSVNGGQSTEITGTWQPGPTDCGMYQVDMQIDTAPQDKIVGVGMIRVKNCQAAPPPVQVSCDSISIPDNITAGSTIEVGLTGKGVESFGLHYAPTRQDYCPANTWQTLQGVIPAVENVGAKYSWNTAGLAPGKYYVAATSKFTNGTNCSANPSGACGTQFGECKQCGKEVTIVAAETPGACNNITLPDSVTQGDSVAISVNATNFITSKVYYARQQASYCPVNGVNPWTEIVNTVPSRGDFTWDTTSIAPGDYYIAANVQLTQTKWCSANPSIAQCASGFEACTQCGKPITVKPKPVNPPPPTGGMCLNLCGVASTTPSNDYSACAANGNKVGTPTINGYLNFKCKYTGTVSSGQISISKDGGSYQNLTTTYDGSGYVARYQIPSAGTYAARCDITPQEPGTYTPPQMELPPTGTQTACPLSDTANYSCVSDLGACAAIGETEFISLPGTGQAVPKYSCPNVSQICCKKDPAKATQPRCSSLPAGTGGTPRCIIPSLTACKGETRSDANCSELPGSVCCVPSADSQQTTTPSITEQKQACINAGGTCDIGSCARYKTQISSISCPNTADGQATVCCKDATTGGDNSSL
jgi:hypothetical protein